MRNDESCHCPWNVDELRLGDSNQPVAHMPVSDILAMDMTAYQLVRTAANTKFRSFCRSCMSNNLFLKASRAVNKDIS